jgi:DNA-binding Xre family transcriptional regulator
VPGTTVIIFDNDRSSGQLASEIKYSNFILKIQTKVRKKFEKKPMLFLKMLNYSKIEMLRAQKKIPKMEFYKSIEMTDTGYKKMLESNSMKVSTLEKIAEILGVKPTSFFEDASVGEPDDLQKKYIDILERFTQLQSDYAALLKQNQLHQEPQKKLGNGA